MPVLGRIKAPRKNRSNGYFLLLTPVALPPTEPVNLDCASLSDMLFCMARKPARKRKFNLRKARIASNVTIGALAAFDVVKGAITPATTSDYRLVSVNLAYQIVDLGAAIDDGQEFGLAHSDYSATEIEECLEAAASFDVGDKLNQEKANRLVRSIGFMTGDPTADSSLYYKEGQKVKTRLNWKMALGDTLDVWIRNGSDTIYTTGATVAVIGEAWLKDGL